MKELAAFVFLIVLVFVGWNQSYRAQWMNVTGQTTPRPATPFPATPVPAPQSIAAATPPPATPPGRDASWLWGKTSLDATPPPADAKGGGKGGGKRGH